MKDHNKTTGHGRWTQDVGNTESPSPVIFFIKSSVVQKDPSGLHGKSNPEFGVIHLLRSSL